MTLADWLAEQGMSQYEFAGRLRTSQPNVSRWVSGRTPRRDHLRQIVEITGGRVTPNDFLAREGAQ